MVNEYVLCVLYFEFLIFSYVGTIYLLVVVLLLFITDLLIFEENEVNVNLVGTRLRLVICCLHNVFII